MKYRLRLFVVILVTLVFNLSAFTVTSYANTFSDDFESYFLGQVAGQGGWQDVAIGTYWQVKNTEVYGGGHAIGSTNCCLTNFTYSKVKKDFGTSQASGDVVMYARFLGHLNSIDFVDSAGLVTFSTQGGQTGGGNYFLLNGVSIVEKNPFWNKLEFRWANGAVSLTLNDSVTQTANFMNGIPAALQLSSDGGGFYVDEIVDKGGNTPAGSNVIVGPINGVTLTFSQVTQEGQTTVASSSSGTQPPSGFKLGNPPIYHNISTTAVFNPPVEVCISYDDTQFRQENNLKLTHFENGQWVNVTTSLDTVNNIICGNVSFFSEFALFEDLDVGYIVSQVEEFNLDKDIEQGLLDKLNAAQSALNREQNKTAANILKAFANQVKAQKGKKITNEQANILLADANELIEVLNGGSLFSMLKSLFASFWNRLLGFISFGVR